MLKKVLFALLILLGGALAPQAMADRDHHHHGGGHWSGGVVIGVPWGWGPGYGYGPPYPYGYGYPWPYERRVIIERERVPRTEIPSGPPPAAYWYYCDSAGAYYPWVDSCPEPWREVPVEPPSSSARSPQR